MLYTKAFATATLLDGLIPIEVGGQTKTKFEHFGGQIPAFAKHLRTWGEAGTVKIKTKTTPKLADSGVQCMMVGYATSHAGDTYEMWDPKTRRIHVTRDVIWMKRMFFQPDEQQELGVQLGEGYEIGTIEAGEGEGHASVDGTNENQ